MMKLEIYDYPLRIKIVSIIAPITILLTLGAFLASPLISGEFRIPRSQFLILCLVAAPLILGFAIAVHLMYPDVHVRDGREFKIKSFFIESRWYRWDEIIKVGIPDQRRRIIVYTIQLPDLNRLFWAIGLTRGIFGTAFMIHPFIRQGQRLMKKMIKERPDLFPTPEDLIGRSARPKK